MRKTRQHNLLRYNRRQRKKHHLGEFQECVFEVAIQFSPALNEQQFHQFLDDVIAFVENRELELWGLGGSPPLFKTTGYIQAGYKSGRLSPSDDDKIALLTWMQNYPQINTVYVSDFIDAWYGFDEPK